MEDLSYNKNSTLINEQNTNQDNNNIKNWLNHIVEETFTVNVSTTAEYKCRKVNASKLQTKGAPASLKKDSDLSINDKLIWDQVYIEEYDGLHTQSKTLEYIMEAEYKALRPIVGIALPTYAISILKKDENRKPVRAKYRIVVLENLDPYNWSKSEYFALVIFQMELNFMMSLAFQLKTEPKQRDFIQAFSNILFHRKNNIYVNHPSGVQSHLRILISD